MRFLLMIMKARNTIQVKTGFSGGFSLIEMLVVIAIIGLVASIPMVNFNSSNRRFAITSGQATVIQALESARNKSTSGVGNDKHGVHVEHNKVIPFEGAVYPGHGTSFPLPPNITTDQAGTDVIFSRIAGTTTARDIIISDTNGNARTLHIKENGSIQ